MNYKLSSFNYILCCADGSLRLYNSMYGANSLIAISSQLKGEILSVLNGTSSIDRIPEYIKDELIKCGYIVPTDSDEDYALEIKNIKTIMNEKYLQLVIMPTEQCNFRCRYCYETFEKPKMTVAQQNAIIKYVQKNISNYSGLSVSWFGGEPLLALDVVEYLSENFLRICKVTKRVYMSSITTNGYELTTDVFKKLYKLKILSYQITLDGFRPQHDSQRVLANGSGTFDRIVNNLIEIKSIKAFGTVFNIRTNYTRSIMENIDDYLGFFKRTFDDDYRFNLYIQQATDYGGERIRDFYGELLPPSHTLVLEKMKEYGITLKRGSHYNDLYCEGNTCYAAKANSFVIGSDGMLYKCTVHFDLPDNKIGRLNENGYMELNENLRKWVVPFYNPKDKCIDCFNRAKCLPRQCPYATITSGNTSCPPMGREHFGAYMERFDDSLFNKIELKDHNKMNN